MSAVIDRLNEALEGRYRVERELGEGGMATVFLARDLRHDRKVALKVLKPELAAVVGAERFLAEIKTTAQLQHPHILPLHDSGEADGFLFYVMPYIEGESLRERLEREHQLPVDEAVEIARDVADALDYAHRQGVVHRDIKPANILLHEGRPQLADFGIALAVSEAGEGRLTETGLSMGTPHYMSPEQAAGERTVDARTDVYALGCVLYEMLAGQPPFPGASAQAVLARILTTDPAPVTAARRSVPANVEAAVARALEKLPADRFSSVKAFREALDDPSFRCTVRSSGTGAGGAVAAGATGPMSASTVSRGGAWLLVAAAAAALAGGWILGSRGPASADDGPVVRVPFDVGDLQLGEYTGITLSPDGTAMAVAAGSGEGEEVVYVRRSHDGAFRPLPGTAGGRSPGLAFSPDGDWLVFSDDGGGLSKVALAGGNPVPIVAASLALRPGYPHWGDDGMIVFGGSDGLYELSADGGDPTLLAEGDFRNFLMPRRLPGGRGVVGFSVLRGGVWVYDPGADSVRTLIPDAEAPTYVEPGYLLYKHPEGGLWAVPFDLEELELQGRARPVLDEVTGAYSVSDNGMLVYSTGEVATADDILLVLVPLDGGPLDTLPPGPRDMSDGAFSPDGSRIAFVARDRGVRNVFIHDMGAGGLTQQFTFDGSRDPVWSPDGTRIAFSARGDSSTESDIYVKPVDGSEEARPLVVDEGSQIPQDWAPGGLLFYRDGITDSDIRVRRVGDEAVEEPAVATRWAEYWPRLSPDGGWLAYLSWEGDERGEIYVQRFPEGTGKQRVSREGGYDPRWSPEGDVLYYLPEEGGIVAARVRLEPTFAVLEREVVYPGPFRSYDVHPTEPLLLVMTSRPVAPGAQDSEGAEDPDDSQWLMVDEGQWFLVVNWFTELRERLGEARE